jgi:hypothetical protein
MRDVRPQDADAELLYVGALVGVALREVRRRPMDGDDFMPVGGSSDSVARRRRTADAMMLKPLSPRRAAHVLENARDYLKDSLRRVGPTVALPRTYVERLRRDLQRAADQLHILANLDRAGCITWPSEEAKASDARFTPMDVPQVIGSAEKESTTGDR